jgi:hypothetical protein
MVITITLNGEKLGVVTYYKYFDPKFDCICNWNLSGEMGSRDDEIPVLYGKQYSMVECKLMMVSHDMLVTMRTWKNNNTLTWMDDSRSFHNKLEYGVKRRNVGN